MKGAGQAATILGLFVLSFATLALEVMQVRIFSYTMNHGFSWLAIGLAMLGFGVSGTLLTFQRKGVREGSSRGFGGALLGFALLVVGVHAAFARLSHRVSPEDGLNLFSPAVLVLLLFVAPYAVAGWATARALFTGGASHVGRLYAVNLVGAALGCWAVYPLLEHLGAPRALLLLSGAAAAAAIPALGSWGKKWAGMIALLMVAALPWAPHLFPFRPDEADQLSAVRRVAPGEPVSEFHRWDPVGRVDVVRFPGEFGLFGSATPCAFFSQDAGAGSFIADFASHPDAADDLVRGTLYGLAGQLRPASKALVIGLGGGPDLVALHRLGMKRLVGCEINGAVIELLGDVYRTSLGLPPPGERGFELVHADGRSYAEAHPGAFDVIQMTGADTYAAAPAGGSVLAESYLYTVEGFEALLGALSADGILAVTRFSQESARVFNTARAALVRLGVDDPMRHLALVHQGPHAYWGAVLVKRSPFTADEIAKLDTLCRQSAGAAARCRIPFYDVLGFSFATPMRLAWSPFLGVDLDGAERLLAKAGFDVSPVTDDRPFFFQFGRLDELSLAELGQRLAGSDVALNPHQGRLLDFLVIAIQLTLVAFVLVFLPGAYLGWLRGPSSRPLRSASLFAALGVGFMLIELGLMQKTGLFLGHPQHSITTILSSLLFFSGLGSLLARPLGMHRGRRVWGAIGGIAVWVAAFHLLGGESFHRGLTLAPLSRVGRLVAWVAPLGILLGLPFPALISRLRGRRAGLAWASNGFASVCASLVAVPFAMGAGFTAVLFAGVGAYFVAGLLVPRDDASDE